MKIREYSAVIEDRDMIRVQAVNLKDAVRQIASHCETNELFRLNGSIYRVNGRLARQPASRLKSDLACYVKQQDSRLAKPGSEV